MKYVSGAGIITANIIAAKTVMVARIGLAVMDVAGGVARNAQSGHDKGTNAHGRGRYENQTMKLTRSIKAYPYKANLKEISATVVASAKNNGFYYGTALEVGFFHTSGKFVQYPFMVPALYANRNYMNRRMYLAVAI